MVIIIAIIVVVLILKFAKKHDKKHNCEAPVEHKSTTAVKPSPVIAKGSNWNNSQYTYIMSVMSTHVFMLKDLAERDYTIPRDVGRQYMYLIMAGTELCASDLIDGVNEALRDYLQRDCWKNLRGGISWNEFIKDYEEFLRRAIAAGLDREKLNSVDGDYVMAAFRTELRYVNGKFFDINNLKFNDIIDDQLDRLLRLIIVKTVDIAQGKGIVTPEEMAMAMNQ